MTEINLVMGTHFNELVQMLQDTAAAMGLLLEYERAVLLATALAAIDGEKAHTSINLCAFLKTWITLAATDSLFGAVHIEVMQRFYREGISDEQK